VRAEGIACRRGLPKNPLTGNTRGTSMDKKKILIIAAAFVLVIMMVYLTFIKARKPGQNQAVKPAATAEALPETEEDSGNPDCAEFDKAFVKTARTIRNAAVWENKGAPYVITGEIVIAKTATFTLKPGVIIKMMGKDAGLTVKGRFISKGTKDKPVIITSINDDVGGDTNCDGAKTKPAAGDYGAVKITGKKTGEVEIRYAAAVK
jgi:hypothetical protein